MINHALGCIYVHIPKTGGNSINRVFGIGWENHKDLRRYQAEMEIEQFATYYKFAIVRNPWDRLLSDYNYQRKKSRPPETKLGLFTAEHEVRQFREWVVTVLSDPYRYEPAAWGAEVSRGIHRWSPQVDWISLEGKIAVDRVLRIERLDESFHSVCSALRLTKQHVPRRNRRLHWHYSWYYDRETREIVADYYRRDIEAFGYRFESQLDRARSVFRRYTSSLLVRHAPS